MRRLLIALSLSAAALLAACSSEPKIIQTTSDATEIRLVTGMATQIEPPRGERIVSVTTGDNGIVTFEHRSDVINLMGVRGGETNLIMRTVSESGKQKTYQYRLFSQAR